MYKLTYISIIDSVKINSPQGRISAASYFMSYKLTTVPESNEKGQWFGWDIKKHIRTVDLHIGTDIYLAARDFHKVIKEGSVKVADPINEEQDSDDRPM